ncbi:MAG: inositol monophosphatase family protein [Vulcanimicrobiaceae bacterium]
MDPLHCAIETAREAGAEILRHVGTELAIEQKVLRADLVTRADRASETLIVGRLRSAFPNASILAEEGGAHAGTSDERWIVDPLDGTTNFAHDYPMYCVSIAYERAGRVVAAAIYAPALDEMYAAEAGAGATLGSRRLAVTRASGIGESLVCTGFKPAQYDRNGAHFAALSRIAQGVRRDGSAALDLAFVAAGRFDAFWEFDLHPWDVAAGALIVCEAGGRVTSIDGAPFVVDGRSMLATNGAVHDEMVVALDLARSVSV